MALLQLGELCRADTDGQLTTWERVVRLCALKVTVAGLEIKKYALAAVAALLVTGLFCCSGEGKNPGPPGIAAVYSLIPPTTCSRWLHFPPHAEEVVYISKKQTSIPPMLTGHITINYKLCCGHLPASTCANSDLKVQLLSKQTHIPQNQWEREIRLRDVVYCTDMKGHAGGGGGAHAREASKMGGQWQSSSPQRWGERKKEKEGTVNIGYYAGDN